MPLYSYSRIDCFEQCPRKYKFRYIEKPEIHITEGVEAFMGKMVHEALEQCYRLARLEKTITRDELLAFFRRRWEESLPADIKVVRENMTADDYFRVGARALERFHERHYPFDQEITLGLEQRVVFPLDSEGKYKMQGYVDRLSRDRRGWLRIQDYKTSGNLPTQQDIDRDTQLPLYQVAIQDMWPDNNGIELVWHYLQFDTILISHRLPEQLEELRRTYIGKVTRIERAEELGNFPTNETSLCDWCEYFELCPAKGGKGAETAAPQVELRPISDAETVSLVDEYVVTNAQIKNLEKRLQEIRDLLVTLGEPGTSTLLSGSGTEGIVLALQKIAKLPTRSSNPGAVEEIRKLVEKAGLWGELAVLDLGRLEKALTDGDLPSDLTGKLAAFQSYVVQDRMRIKKLG